MKSIICYIFLSALSLNLLGQKHQETIKKELSFSSISKNNTLIIDNVYGFIQVEMHTGNNIILEVNEQLSARTQSELTKAKNDLQLKTKQLGDTIEIYIEGLCDCNCDRRKGHYGWNNCNRDIDYTYDFKVKVPATINLFLSTVNDGDIRIQNVKGTLKAKNVNGGIFILGAKGATSVHTINGDVEVKYESIPAGNSSYYTLNGDLEVFLPKDLNADMNFKSFNGEFFTDFETRERLPARVVTSNRRSGTFYKIEDITSVRVGNGGLLLDFETFNGDIFIKKNK